MKKRRHERNWKRFFIRLTCFFWGIASGIACLYTFINGEPAATAILVFIVVSVFVWVLYGLGWVFYGVSVVALLLVTWIYTGVDDNDEKIWRLWNIVPIAVTFGVSLWAGIAIAGNQGLLIGILSCSILVFLWFVLCAIVALAGLITDLIWSEFIEKGTVKPSNSRVSIWIASVSVSVVGLLLIAAFSHS